MRRLPYTATVMAAVLVAVLAGCSATLPDEPAGIEGVVTNVDEAVSGSFVYLVEVPEAQRGSDEVAGYVSDKAAVTADADTALFDDNGESGDSVTIAEGSRVRVWFEGAVAESYPVQGRAKVIQVLAESPL